MNMSPRPAALAVAIVLCAVCGLVAPARADPLNPLDFPSLGRVTLVSGAYSIDTTSATPKLIGPGTILSGTVSASGVAVFRFDDLTVSAGAVLTAGGGAEATLTRPVALLASGSLIFAGTLDASGARGTDGTGSGKGTGGRGAFGGGSGTGGVASKPGGAGGSVNAVEPAIRLSGGSGGSGGLSAGPRGGGGGGGGGGAVELGALGALTLTGGTISVNGGDGGGVYGGPQEGGSSVAAGGGGGGGGAVLLHGHTVTLGGTINARGGNGGRGIGNGDDGGGGRAAIQATANPGTAGISVAGGRRGDSSRAGAITFVRPTLTATDLDFGSVTVGSSITVAITIRNTGDEGSFINGQFPAASAPFARIGTGIFSGIRSGASVVCEYTCAPTALGSFKQKVEFLSNAGPASLTIYGTGVASP